MPGPLKRKRCTRCGVLRIVLEFGVHQFGPNEGKRTKFSQKCLNSTNGRSVERKNYYRGIRLSIIKKYGGKCVCCGETVFEFLTIDHVQKDGQKHEKTHNGDRLSMYREIAKSPVNKNKFQILCWNCNCAKGSYGKCPHENV